MTDNVTPTTIRDAVEARLSKRYRSESRFRSYGAGAVLLSFLILVLLLGSITAQGLSAFTAHEITLEVELEQGLVDPAGDASEESIRQGSFSRVLQNAMREAFPEVRARRDLRELFQLYTPLNAPRLMDEVLSDPDLIGQTYRFRMPISDEMDLYLKGDLIEERTVAGTGALDVVIDGDEAALTSETPVFQSVFASVTAILDAEAGALEARARALELQAEAAEARGETVNLDRIEQLRLRAEGLRQRASAPDDQILLDESLPSLIVETGQGAIGLTRLSSDGLSATGDVIVGLEPQSGNTDWQIQVFETPEDRRRATDNQIVWTRVLIERGLIEQNFNSYLFTNADSREPELAGVKGAFFGSVLTMLVTMLLSVPIGVAAAIYLEEFARKNTFTDLIEVNINNLAAVPSIVFGLLGLAVFINMFGLPRSAPLLGGVVLSLMTLPTMIIATRAALKAVPPSIRQAALGIGASKTQTVFHHVLPLAAPGILTGSIIGLARALGETAPLLMIGMVAFIADAPSLDLDGLTEPATVMPVQIYLWYDGAERAFEARTAAAIMILLVMMISFNALAIYLRRRFERRW